ncbi:MAG: universal stress protein [Cyclobacteriaceae bacterium]|nr:universal stress protein [Cyclobacteriaceae bacterium]
MKKILVPYDFTDIAEKGYQLAIHFAQMTASEIYLVHFFPEPYQSSMTVTGDVNKKIDDEMHLFNIEMVNQANQKLQHKAEQAHSEGFIVYQQVLNSKFSEGIHEFVSQHNIDLIIMGTSGEQTFGEQFTGNHVEKTVYEVDCPVISVKGNYNPSNFGKIVLAMEEIPKGDSNKNFKFLKYFTKALNATVHFAYVTDQILESKQVSEIQHRLDLLAIEHGMTNYSVSVINHRDETTGIIQFARKIQAGFIGIIKQNQAGILRFFTSYFSDDMVKEAEMPVITFSFVED